jgi:hypothetical protein
VFTYLIPPPSTKFDECLSLLPGRISLWRIREFVCPGIRVCTGVGVLGREFVASDAAICSSKFLISCSKSPMYLGISIHSFGRLHNNERGGRKNILSRDRLTIFHFHSHTFFSVFGT